MTKTSLPSSLLRDPGRIFVAIFKATGREINILYIKPFLNFYNIQLRSKNKRTITVYLVYIRLFYKV